MTEDNIKFAIEWALERGFRQGFAIGFDIGEQFMAHKHKNERIVENGVRNIKSEEVESAMRIATK